jgi:hypothetical protein
LCLSSCSDYLDVVPDNVATIDYAFRTRYQTEGFLYGLFSFLPEFANTGSNPALMGGDEMWFTTTGERLSTTFWYLTQEGQGSQDPLGNYWASQQNTYGLRGGKPLFTALRDCNIFLENVHIPFDVTEDERTRWVGEALFLKAFYHFWLFRMYGPIPLIKENVDIDAVKDAVRPPREPIDTVTNYIVSLLDSAVVKLPLEIGDKANELGRPTKAIALALKAQTLTLAASPLFNGTEEEGANPYYINLTDKQGVHLFPQSYSVEKWERAALALKEAIDMADLAKHCLYDFRITNAGLVSRLNNKTILAMQVRGAATERWNEEIIWGDSRSNTDALQRACQPKFITAHQGGGTSGNYAPTQRVVEQFYTKNGVPIEEDKDWENIDPMALKTATAEDRFYIQQSFQTVNLFFDREARFYGSIIFDGGTLYGNGKTSEDDLWVTKMKFNQASGTNSTDLSRQTVTGYLNKKLLNFKSTLSATADAFTQERYAFPIIRLADLYLMYAEALNESKSTPDEEVYLYIDSVRHRTGLPGVVESWHDHALNPGKPLTKAGMRDIIQRERLNELAFEGSRFWDLRRWNLAETYLNRPVRGLNVFGEREDFYTITELSPLKFTKKEYLWPIKVSNLAVNTNLVQNPGW